MKKFSTCCVTDNLRSLLCQQRPVLIERNPTRTVRGSFNLRIMDPQTSKNWLHNFSVGAIMLSKYAWHLMSSILCWIGDETSRYYSPLCSELTRSSHKKHSFISPPGPPNPDMWTVTYFHLSIGNCNHRSGCPLRRHVHITRTGFTFTQDDVGWWRQGNWQPCGDKMAIRISNKNETSTAEENKNKETEANYVKETWKH
jgi:hypothetical protein